EMITESTPLRCRKLSNPDIFSSAGKTKLHRQLSQDDCKLRRGSLASSLSGKQLLPLSSSVHSGVGQTIWQPPGDTSNLVRMRNQSLGQSAPSLTAGLVALHYKRMYLKSVSFLAARKNGLLGVSQGQVRFPEGCCGVGGAGLPSAGGPLAADQNCSVPDPSEFL
ncbi:PREDICTED: microtubule-associated serine/threonine-protein kinase 2-like, partial [Chlamydotis macqueenii]